ncbi:MAG: AI-2E family transporter [Candidatus Doudnabacteria bacterium]|nr:AI-2E family transporter [Candidatus Doudnabacteria bacterium]
MTTENKNKQLVGFFVMLAIVGLLTILMIWPMWQVLALAGIFGVLFHPFYRRIRLDIKNDNLAAILTILLVILIAILPLWLIGQMLFNEIVNVYHNFTQGQFVLDKSQIAGYIPEQFKGVVESLNNDINAIISRFTGSAFDFVSQLLSNIVTFFLSLFLMIFILFFFLRDGEKIKELFREISPLSSSYENTLFERLETAVSGVVKGTFLVALTQGIVATIGFLIFGVPQPFLWGAFTMLAAFVPTVGTSLSIIPAVIYLLVVKETGSAIGMAIWGVLAVGMIDNFVSPKLVGSKIKMHPLLVLLSVLGGIQFFGFLGFLFGPLLMSVFITLLDIFRQDIKKNLFR